MVSFHEWMLNSRSPLIRTVIRLKSIMLANAGIPMLALHLPAMLILLAPICIIEYFVARRTLTLPRKWIANGVLWANVATTLLGVPLTWAAMLALNIATTDTKTQDLDTLPGLAATVVLQSSWLNLPEPGFEWLIPAATLVLLVPYFFVSVFTERLVLQYLWNDSPKSVVNRICWTANSTTYAMLACLVVATLFINGG
ncbi:hypothetical protein [Crateriforma conspicua]|uniref:Uncharacterized protein n=1 Tax=Crateriforma conspicua TaxID=2527996 RepID=A0A5C5YD06_9PLAN|nr:hypothetical protein [Crateriforma conspicua]TWT72663.1 hypothetical protein Pan14r_49830 [Crateriforma conspicua]